MACPIKENCTFFNNQIRMMEERKKSIRTRFCLSTYSQCARFKVFENLKSKDKIPADLYPNNFERADELMRQSKTYVSQMTKQHKSW